MAKYDPLGNYLSKLKGGKSTLTFQQVAGIIGARLPPSAYSLRQWWENSRSHVQAIAWDDAGWMVDNIDFQKQVATFKRKP